MKHSIAAEITAPDAPGPELYRTIRAAFVAQGKSLGAWCSDNCVFRQNARDCLLGNWKGPAADQLRTRLIDGAGLSR